MGAIEPSPEQRSERAEIAELHRRLQAGELGAVQRARRHLLDGTWARGSAADLRYFLRVLADAGLLGAVSLSELLAEALRCLDVAWPTKSDDDDDDFGDDTRNVHDLNALCASVESCAVPSDLTGFRFGKRQDPVLRIAGHAVRNCIEEPDLLPILQRTANAVALVRGQLAPEGVRGDARADVYRRVLGRLAASVRETEVDPKRDATRLVGWLVDVGMMRLAQDASRESLESKIAALRELPAQARPEALEAILFSEPIVEELFATRADLARVLAEWG
jgi:hypothetical protein